MPAGKSTIFKKSVAVSLEDLDFLKSIKGDKSVAEKNREIINYYKLNYKHVN